MACDGDANDSAGLPWTVRAVTNALLISTCTVGLVLASWAAIVDARTHRLPNELVAAVAAVGGVGLALAGFVATDVGLVHLVDLVSGAVCFAGPWLVLNLFAPSSVGFGDVKYAAALGLYIGWFDPALGLLAGVATIVLAWPQSVAQTLRRGSSVLPLGPYLLGGTVLSLAVFA